MSNNLTLVTSQNIQEVTSGAPAAYEGNKLSHDRCIAFGQTLLEKVRLQGMSDELDKEIAEYIERAKKTVKKMNDTRSPITKLFDEFRNVFTTMENEVSVTKSGTIPFQLQAERNRYAQQKLKEEEERRAAEEQKRLIAQAETKMRTDLVEDFKRQFNELVREVLNNLERMNGSLTLGNWDDVTKQIKSVSDSLSPEWINNLRTCLYSPYVSQSSFESIRASVCQELTPKLIEQFAWEIGGLRDSIVEKLPSKKRELMAAAQASEEEARRIQEQMKAREAAEAARREAERKEAEEAEKRQREMAAQMSEMSGLFDAAAASAPSYQTKASLKKKINPLNPEAFPVLLGFWWDGVGRHMSVEELSKMFKTVITYCEKRANDKTDPAFIESEHIEYVDDVKAK